jgi:hypothetical protein
MGNSVFKAAGATFVAQKETARLMQQTQPKEMARRGAGFKSRGYDPDDVKLVLPDVTFDSEMTIRLDAVGGAAGYTDCGRIRNWLRGDFLVGCWRAQEYAR